MYKEHKGFSKVPVEASSLEMEALGLGWVSAVGQLPSSMAPNCEHKKGEPSPLLRVPNNTSTSPKAEDKDVGRIHRWGDVAEIRGPSGGGRSPVHRRASSQVSRG